MIFLVLLYYKKGVYLKYINKKEYNMLKTLRLVYTTKLFSDGDKKRFDFENVDLPVLEEDLNFLINNVFDYFLNEQKNAPAIIYSDSDDVLAIYISYLSFKDIYVGLFRLNSDLLNDMILKRLEMIVDEKGLCADD